MKLCTVGLGYIGLPTSIMFARYGVDVIGIDVQQSVVESLNNGKIHIEEPGLQEALEDVVSKEKFRASLSPEEADVFIIAVPTPNKDDLYKSCDLSFVLGAVNTVLPYVEKGNVLIIESTIGPRTMDDHVKPLVESYGYVVGQDIFLVHCPERVLPGQIMNELIYNNRIVGGITPACTEAGAKVYETFVKGEIIKTEAKTAEMSKLMENTFRDVNIALANELTKVSNELGINALEVIEMANKHPRVNLHTPGPGVGGHCLAVDPYFVVAAAPETAEMIYQARKINSSMPNYVIDQIDSIMENVDGHTLTIFGLTYKGNVDDIRESPAMEIMDELLKQDKYDVRAYDPHVQSTFVTEDIDEATINSDLIVVLTDHNEFKSLDLNSISHMRNKQIFDTKNIIKQTSSDFEIINFGNLHSHVRRKEVAVQ